ncbi:alanine--tRNA ligase [Thiohalomonas denitrificans]|uniref:alanine--tRNA ligase n=1 Tax=Thiohalomonas denitrificans TaxID=415747 RepID=UPI0026EA6D1D|nr:alanine--tRNA ligase [Thiohalomonas denitrificans]
MNTSAEIRTAFLEFFRGQGHQVVPSSSLVPANDPTLLFTNAGMVQFKDIFLGLEQRGYSRATSVQRCVRAGGKHNDLDNVGYTARHHTFFEMLGNFSFGDYFKREAIGYAWDFLTRTCGLPAEKLWVTVYEDDDEAADIWLKELKVDPGRFSRCGAKDNFWSMGETGPCGPCSEIFYDHGPEVPGGPPGSPDEDGDRYIEIWNLVFMQYDRDAKGELKPLPKPSVDTGMGLERLAAVMQGVHSNYEIDLFQHLIKAAAKLAGIGDLENKSLRVISDHIRSCAFLVVDGVIPSNEGRGYVLRRIIRRAVRHGHKLALREPFFHKLVAPLAEMMGDAYPELSESRARVEQILKQEEERFAETLEQGMAILEEAIGGLTGREIPGETLFKLYDTYGFPADLTADIARERGLSVDMAGFEREMEIQRERARSASQFSGGYAYQLEIEGETEFTGYDSLTDSGEILELYLDGKPTNIMHEGQEGLVVLDRTPFYAESGGQVGDCGTLSAEQGSFDVRDTRKLGRVHAHFGMVSHGELRKGGMVKAHVDPDLRGDTVRHHSATHLLHAALRQVLGEHVQQKGSLVAADRLRFDFSHFEAITPEQLKEIEALINRQIRENVPVEAKVMALEEARESGAMALFGEKYGNEVRVLRMGDFSVELCGGIHVKRTGDIGLCRIISEAGVAAGVRRIEAVCGAQALRHLDDTDARLDRVAGLVKGSRESFVEKVEQLVERSRGLEKELEKLKAKLASAQGSDLASQVVQVDGVKVLSANLEGADPKSLRDTMDQLKNKLGSAVIVLGTAGDGKVNLAAGVTKDLTHRVKAGDLVNAVAGQVGGKGGGRPDMAMAGGNQPEALNEALGSVEAWVRERLGG